MTISFGVMLLQSRPIDDMIDWAQRYEAAGADSLWVCDHVANSMNVEGLWWDGWVSLAALARETTTARLGMLVTTFVSHPPLEMARLAASIDDASGGRFDLGIGAGGAAVDRSVGQSTATTMKELVHQLDGGLSELQTLLSGGRTQLPPAPTIAGRSVPPDIGLHNAVVPRRRIPIVIGGQGPSTIDVAARYADRWNTYGVGRGKDTDAFEALSANSALLDERARAAGREPESIGRSVLLDVVPDLRATTVDELAELVRRVHGLGFAEVIAYSWIDPDMPRTDADLLRFITDELPALRESLA